MATEVPTLRPSRLQVAQEGDAEGGKLSFALHCALEGTLLSGFLPSRMGTSAGNLVTMEKPCAVVTGEGAGDLRHLDTLVSEAALLESWKSVSWVMIF